MIVYLFEKSQKDTDNQDGFQNMKKSAAKFINKTQISKISHSGKEFSQKKYENHNGNENKHKCYDLDSIWIPMNKFCQYFFYENRKLYGEIDSRQQRKQRSQLRKKSVSKSLNEPIQ